MECDNKDEADALADFQENVGHFIRMYNKKGDLIYSTKI
jgi:hypothetical protein